MAVKSSSFEVSRDKLLERLYSRRRQVQEQYLHDLDAYEEACVAWLDSLVGALNATKEAIESSTPEEAVKNLGSSPCYRGGAVHIDVPVEYPQKPQLATKDLSRDIVLLEMSTNETVKIDSSSRWERYLS